MLVKLARTVSRELYWEKRVWTGLEGVATTLCCCAKLDFMLFTIDLWRRAGLLKLWVAAPSGIAKWILGSRNQLAWQIRYSNFCKIYKKIGSRPAV